MSVLPALICPSYAGYGDSEGGGSDTVDFPGNDVIRGVDDGEQGVDAGDNLARLVRRQLKSVLAGDISPCEYVAIDVSGRWPTDSDPRDIAARAAMPATHLDISEQEIYEYLSRVALGSQRLDEVFADEGVGTIPLFATANLLLKFGPEDKEWWEYLAPESAYRRRKYMRTVDYSWIRLTS